MAFFNLRPWLYAYSNYGLSLDRKSVDAKNTVQWAKIDQCGQGHIMPSDFVQIKKH